MINGVLAQVHHTQWAQWIPKPILWLFSLVQECIIKILSNLQYPHIGLLTYGVRPLVVENAKWKPLELSPSRKTVNQKQYCFPEGLQRLVLSSRTWKMQGCDSTTFNMPICHVVQKTDGSWRRTEDYHKLNQGVSPTAAAIPDSSVAWPNEHILWYSACICLSGKCLS